MEQDGGEIRLVQGPGCGVWPVQKEEPCHPEQGRLKGLINARSIIC
jgi:hypothetical protein